MIKLELVKTDSQKEKVKNIIKTHHSYVPTYRSVGRRIDWLIEYNDEIIGMIGVGSSTYPPCKDMLNYLDITKQQYKLKFNTFANNWRFCLSKKIKNIGTQILKKLREVAPIEWKLKYGDTLKYLITFVGGGNNGAVYKADNWMLVGQTSGLPKHRSSSMKWNSKEELKKLFVKPTGENKKLIFLKEIK